MITQINNLLEDIRFALEMIWLFMRADARREYRLWWDEMEAEQERTG